MADPQIQAGMHVQPGPVMARVLLVAPNGEQQVVLHLEHSTGSTILPLNGEVAELLGNELTTRRMSKCERDRRDAMMRRVGWGYGYGAGFVDGQRGVYRPGAPPDGKTRGRPIEPIPRRS